MKHIACTIAAAALAGTMTAVPAGAQTEIHAGVLDLPTGVPIAVANRLPAENEEVLIIETTPSASVAQQRHFDSGRETYAVFDPDASVWRIHDAVSEAVIGTVAVGQPVSPQVGMATDEIAPALAATPVPESAPKAALRAGIAEERYYDADRGS